MIIKKVEIEKFRAFENVSFLLGKRITAIAGRNATQKTTLLGMIGQPFTISKNNPMCGCQTVDGYNFRSQFKEKFKISPNHDTIGEHKWTLHLYDGIYSEDHFTVESIARKEKGKKEVLRFWNASGSRKKGAGYVQLPVYFLSLSRLFPIGEDKKTTHIDIDLTKEEIEYCIDKYREILTIHEGNNTYIGLEKGSSSKVFTGISDDVHDIFTNSAGEGNVAKIILAVLSFKRLKEKYGKDYKGGILLIDEVDATLHGFSQKKLIDYLWNSAKEFKIQIVFTTHSPIILKCVNKYQREELSKRGINSPHVSYDSSIVYLKPDYYDEGRRFITAQNIQTSTELNMVLNDMNLMVSSNNGRVKIYCEDALAIDFVKFCLAKKYLFNLDNYMDFMDVNLGWTNYIQLVSKGIPEFVNNIIILDGDVKQNNEYKKEKQDIVTKSGNVLFLPLVIEKDLFKTLKEMAKFNKFKNGYCNVSQLNYDICFSDWPLDVEKYTTAEIKSWYKKLISNLGNNDCLFKFWVDCNLEKTNAFMDKLVSTFNLLADRMEVDKLPIVENEDDM